MKVKTIAVSVIILAAGYRCFCSRPILCYPAGDGCYKDGKGTVLLPDASELHVRQTRRVCNLRYDAGEKRRQPPCSRSKSRSKPGKEKYYSIAIR